MLKQIKLRSWHLRNFQMQKVEPRRDVSREREGGRWVVFTEIQCQVSWSGETRSIVTSLLHSAETRDHSNNQIQLQAFSWTLSRQKSTPGKIVDFGIIKKIMKKFQKIWNFEWVLPLYFGDIQFDIVLWLLSVLRPVSNILPQIRWVWSIGLIVPTVLLYYTGLAKTLLSLGRTFICRFFLPCQICLAATPKYNSPETLEKDRLHHSPNSW